MSSRAKELPKYINGLRVVKDFKYEKSKKRIALFECPHCHEYFETRVDRAKEGRVNSCGCVTNAIRAKSIERHGDCKPSSETYGLRSSWSNMKGRCNNKNHKAFPNYGGRGIYVCDEWNNSYLKFKEWGLSNGWNKGLEINRIDNNKGYEPSNCNWVTSMENTQTKNKRQLNAGASGYRNVTINKRNKVKRFIGRKTVYGKLYATKYYETAKEASDALHLILEGRL